MEVRVLECWQAGLRESGADRHKTRIISSSNHHSAQIDTKHAVPTKAWQHRVHTKKQAAPRQLLILCLFFGDVIDEVAFGATIVCIHCSIRAPSSPTCSGR